LHRFPNNTPLGRPSQRAAPGKNGVRPIPGASVETGLAVDATRTITGPADAEPRKYYSLGQ
jgi:hypothetical protein